MNPYRVHFKLSDGASAYAFDCEADDILHAIEQAKDAYPDDPVISAVLRAGTGSGDLQRDAHGEAYTLAPDSRGVWITVASLSVNVIRTDEGVVVDLYPLDDENGNAEASTWAMFPDVIPRATVASALLPESRA